jgi:hypothetical protein
MPESFPPDYGTRSFLVPVDAALARHVIGALRLLEKRGYWRTYADYEAGYNAVAALKAAMAPTPLPPSRGGTGVDNGSHTLTVPASGTAVLRSAALTAGRVPYAADTNGLADDAGLAYDAAGDELRSGRYRLAEQSAPATPPAGLVLLYSDTAGLLRSLDDAGTNSRASYGRGTAFPAMWPVKVPFFREDLGWWCYHDGTRWLTAHEYTEAFPVLTNITVGTVHSNIPLRTDYKIWIEKITMMFRVDTTNASPNFWWLYIQVANSAYNQFNQVYSIASLSVAVNTWQIAEVVPTQPTMAQPAVIYTQTVKQGTPGPLSFGATVRYRLIVT